MKALNYNIDTYLLHPKDDNFFLVGTVRVNVRRLNLVLIILVLLQGASGLVHAEARAVSTEITIQKYDWLSSEKVVLDVAGSNAPYNVHLKGSWTLVGESNQIILNGTTNFQATGTVTELQFALDKFYQGDHFFTFYFELTDEIGSELDNVEQSFTVFEHTQFPSITNLIAFGDSLSDMGNGNQSAVVSAVFSSPPYWEGRFSNGPVWLEYLSDAYSVTTSFGSGTSQGDNRAFGGSQTGQGYSYVLLPNVGSQITNYFANVESAIPQSTIVSLWSGGNDFLYGTANANTIIANMESHIRQLESGGANEFIIPNLPPLEKTPEVMSRSQNQQNAIGSEVVIYNQKLSTLVGDLRAELGITIHFIDAWGIFNDILQNKDSLGLTNTQDSACSGGVSLLPLPICSSGDPVVSNADEYLFFDKAHPTRVMHQFIGRYATETVGEPDTDGDGVINLYDLCEWTEIGVSINSTGCSWNQQDDDQDGVINANDICPGTSTGDTVNSEGCSPVQTDSDGDGFNDAIDICPFSPSSNDHDLDGCSDEEDTDDDNDGFYDSDDTCPRGLIGNHLNDLDSDGCLDIEDLDIDGDGLLNTYEFEIGTDERDMDTDDDFYPDGDDAFPLDRNEWLDSDGDGCGDNSDLFPYDSRDCADVDEDGVGDNTDEFPFDSSEWADFDQDGIGDNSDICPLEEGYSIIPLGCVDSDGDGYGDRVDAFPRDVDEWNDSDGDRVGDNSDRFPNDFTEWSDFDNDTYGDNGDAFPLDVNEWNDSDFDGVGDNADAFPNNASEWFDSDMDGCGDNVDVWPNNSSECYDQDFDGVGDNADAFPLSAFEWLDSDGDGLGDNSDLFPNDKDAKYDSDGDGVANAYDPFPGNANYDSWFDLVLRIVLLIGLIMGGMAFFQRRRAVVEINKVDSFETETIQNIPEVNRPTAAPSFEAFKSNE